MKPAHLHTGNRRGLVPQPQRVVTIAPNHRNMSLRIALTQFRLTAHLVASVLDDKDAEVGRSYDDVALGIFFQAEDARDDLVGKRIAHEAIARLVVTAEALHAPHPKTVPAVFEKTCHIIVDERRGVVLVEEILCETIAIETVEAILGRHPDITMMVLQDIADGSARQLVGCEQPAAYRPYPQQKGQRQTEHEKTFHQV